MRTSADPGTIALTVLDDQLFVIFRDKNDTNQLYCSHSTNGLQWSNAKKITDNGSTDLKTEKFPGLTTLNGKLLLAYRSEGSDDVYVSLSTDGESWTATARTGIQNSTPALTTYLDDNGMENLAMVYSDKNGAQMHYRSSTDGVSWTNETDVPGKCNRPVLATLGGIVQEKQGQGRLVTVYTDEKGPQLWSHYIFGPDWAGKWQSGIQIPDQQTQNVGGLAWLPQPDSGDLDGCLVLVYQSHTAGSTDAYAITSRDGASWGPAKTFALDPAPDNGYVPALAFHTAINKLVMVYQAGQKLYATFSDDGSQWDPATPM